MTAVAKITTQGTPYRILCVDDEKTQRFLLDRKLNSLFKGLKIDSYEIKIAESGDQGLNEYEKNSFRFYIIDYRMPPGMNGLQLATQILKREPTAPIILYTADTKEKIEQENPLPEHKDTLSRITFIQKDILKLVNHLEDQISDQSLAVQLDRLKV